ncbi:MAG TPA: TlpA disulfide reductase family protein [Bacteroidales bacterium]|nr:TlpA disulfide reductase family protein [Bacteroidales bacterium]
MKTTYKKLLFNILIYLTIASVILSCSSGNQKISTGKVIIAGIIEEAENFSRVISLNHPGLYSNFGDFSSAIIDTNGYFRFEYQTMFPQDIMLRYENGFTKLFLKPQDSVFVTLNAREYHSKSNPDFKISGTESSTSNDIHNYQYYSKLLNTFQLDYTNLSVDEFLEQLSYRIKKEDSLLAEFINEYNPSDEFIQWAKKTITYEYANYLVDFKWYCEDNDLAIDQELFDKKLFPVDDEDAIITTWYHYHLNHYSNKYFQEDSVVINLLKDNQLAEANSTVLQNIIKNENPGVSRDLMCYQILNDVRKESLDDFLQLYDELPQYIDNKELRILLSQRRQQLESDKTLTISTLDSCRMKSDVEFSEDFFSKLGEKFKDTIIYIDIWATWCGPCKSEIPHLINLHNAYKNKPVAFVNICISSNKEDWEQAVEDLNLQGENYFFNKESTQLLKGKLNTFKGIPHYLLIDKKGKIIDEDAPRPSSDNIIKEKLNKLLDNS